MNPITALIELPKELGSDLSGKTVSITGKFDLLLSETGELTLFSTSSNSILLNETGVNSFAWIETTISKQELLAITKGSALILYSFEKLKLDATPFDSSATMFSFSPKQINEHIIEVISVPLKSSTAELIQSGINKIVFIDQNGQLNMYCIFPDGIYPNSTVDSKNCSVFAFDGNNIAGLSSTELHIWDPNCKEIASASIAGTNIIPLAPNQFAVTKDSKALIYDQTGKVTKEYSIKDADSEYVALLPGNNIFSLPKDYKVCSRNTFLPLFLNAHNEICTINDDLYMQRILDIFPLSVAIPILSSRVGQEGGGAEFLAETAVKSRNVGMVENFIRTQDPASVLQFLQSILAKIKQGDNQQFVFAVFKVVSVYCISQIKAGKKEFSDFLIKFRALIAPAAAPQAKPTGQDLPKVTNTRRIRKEELVSFCIEALKKNQVTQSLPVLKLSFPDFTNSFHLFRTIILQQVWVHVCSNQLGEAAKLIEELGEVPGEHFREMWRQTTRNKTRQMLYDYLHKQNLLSEQDEQNHQILLKITTKYPNTSFTVAQKLSVSQPFKNVADDAKLPPWKPIVDLTADYNENANLTFSELFKIPPEPVVESPRYFVGNIALIEAQSPKTIKMLTTEGTSVERLWVLHCEHRVSDMHEMFKAEIDRAKGVNPPPKLVCLKFINTYHNQMNVYELETLLDVLCKNGFFAQFEFDDFELLLVRICKNKFLFDQNWWAQCKIDFADFFKKFATYCAKKSLFMPFEMFVISHPRAKEVDLSEVQEPLIRFIWDLWVKRDPAAATLSCMQFIAKSNSTDPIELWKSLPSESLAPLASFVWNKDPEKFKPGSPETIALSERLKTEYPLLSSLVKGEIPHPKGPEKQKPESKWRSPIYTSKYDLELHDLIASHFDFDFSKVFTNFYGQYPGQPNYPHFDHPELIAAPAEPPYVHYVKSMLPVSAFQQAVEDGVDEDKFKDLCHQCMKEALTDSEVRLAALTFIELTDIKFARDSATDYKLVLAIYDKLASGTNDNTEIIQDLSQIFLNHNSDAAVRLQKKLNPTEIDVFLLTTLLGVRCGLPLDYTPIITFSRRPRPAELLLFIDRAAELGAQYQISEVVKIVQTEMPESKDNPLKDHLLFHLNQSLPAEEGPSSNDVPPALVVFRAVRKAGPQQQQAALLQEALNRKTQLYALLATSVDDADNLLCALVTLMTMVDAPPPIDVQFPPAHDKVLNMFMQVLMKLLLSKKSMEAMQAMELFSDTSIVVSLVHFYRSVELFSFRRTEKVLPMLKEKLSAQGTIEDDLLGSVPVSVIKETFFQMLDVLIKLCAARSQIHVFRFLELLDGCPVSEFLTPRVALCKKIATFDNFRRAIVHCDILGAPDKIVSDLILNHSLALGQAAAECLGTSSANATKQWLTFQYSTAATPAQVLEIHKQISQSIQNADPIFFVTLYAALLPYAQPTQSIEIARYARSLFKDTESKLCKHLDALLVHLQICADNAIEVNGPPGSPPTLRDLLNLLFPRVEITDLSTSVNLSLASPLLFSLDTLQRFFDSSVDRAIDVCLDTRRVADARLLCEWRDRDPHNIHLLETVQMAITGDCLSSEGQQLLSRYGTVGDDLEHLLESIARDKQWRFVLISLHYKAAKKLGFQTSNILRQKTSEFIESKLSITFNEWPLVQQLIKASQMTPLESAKSLANAYANHVNNVIVKHQTLPGTIPIDDYTQNFTDFTKLCETPSAIGEQLFQIAQNSSPGTPLAVRVNLLLHSSICTPDIDECAETLDSLIDTLTGNNELKLIIDIVSVFPDPALLPRYFQYLIAQQKLDTLPHGQLSEKVGRVIMNCARHVHPFEPQKYFDLTLQYSLFRDHAELQMECGARCLSGVPDKSQLQEASRHYLLALAYFLHEKCYSLSMECLKKLSLISLQLEVPEPSILHLDKQQVLNLMCTKDFPFALTIAVAFDMDTEANWAEALYAQSVQNKGEDFLTAFQYFRPITSNLCDGVVRKFKSSAQDDGQKDRMKQFLLNIPNLVERYRIAKSLDFQDQIESMKEVNPVVCEWCERVLMSKQ